MRKIIIIYFILLFSLIYPQSPREKIVQAAYDSLGLYVIPSIDGKYFTSDCIGTVRYIYYKALKIDLGDYMEGGVNGCRVLYKGLLKRNYIYNSKKPEIGDIIFFDNTYDVNRDGTSWQDPISHVGVVVGYGKENTIKFVHYAGGRVRESYMNLNNPKIYTLGDGNYIINSYLKRKKSNENYPDFVYLAPSFYNSFAYIDVLKSTSLNIPEKTQIQNSKKQENLVKEETIEQSPLSLKDTIKVLDQENKNINYIKNIEKNKILNTENKLEGKDYPFIVRYPAGWTVKDLSDDALIMKSPDENASIIIMYYQMSRIYTGAEFMTYMEGPLKKQYKLSINQIPQGERTLKKENLKQFNADYGYAGLYTGVMKNTERQFVFLSLAKRRQCFLIAMIAKEEYYPDYEQLFGDILNSFKIK